MARIVKSTHMGLKTLVFSQIQSIRRLTDAFNALLSEPLDLLQPSMGLTGAFEVAKEALFLVKELISSDLPIYPTINEDLNVGQTDTSNDVSVRGTVQSRKVRDKRNTWLVSDPNWIKHQIDEIIEALIRIVHYEEKIAQPLSKERKKQRNPALVPKPFERPEFSPFSLEEAIRNKLITSDLQKARDVRNAYFRRHRQKTYRGSKKNKS